MRIVPYEIEERESTLAQLAANGEGFVEDAKINLDPNGRPQNCYFVVDTIYPTAADLLAQADMTILDLTEQLIIEKERLS